MKNLKNNYFTKTLSALLTLAILLGTVLCLAPVSAAETEYLGKHDFNDLTQIKSTSNVMTNQDMGTSTAVLGTHEGNSGDKYMIWTKLDNTKAPMWYFFMDANQVSTDTKRSIVAEMKLNFQTLTNAQIQLRDAAGNWSNGVWITDTGEVRIKGATGTLMATIEAKQWYTLSLVCDETTGTVTVYLDYKQIGGFALNASHTYLNRMHIKLNTSTTAPATVLYLDDCVFYKGTAPVKSNSEAVTVVGYQKSAVYTNPAGKSVYNIRFVGYGTDASYQNVGFDVVATETGGAEKSFSASTTSVYKKLKGSTADGTTIDAASINNYKDAKYLFAYVITGVPADIEIDFEVTPKATAANGDPLTGAKGQCTISAATGS